MVNTSTMEARFDRTVDEIIAISGKTEKWVFDNLGKEIDRYSVALAVRAVVKEKTEVEKMENKLSRDEAELRALATRLSA